MISKPPATASAELLASGLSPNFTQAWDWPVKGADFITFQEASLQGHCHSLRTQDLTTADHGSKSELNTNMAGSLVNDELTQLQQKRKCDDSSFLDPPRCETKLVNTLDLCNQSSNDTQHWSAVLHARSSSAKSFHEKRHQEDELPPKMLTRVNQHAGPITLPAEIWHHVFCFVPPVSLGRLSCVNSTFHGYLNEAHAGENLPLISNSIAQPMKAEIIWLASRRRFYPDLPRSLGDLSEVALWRLLRGSNCQVCGKPSITGATTNPGSQWENGPGTAGIRIIWPLGIRTCANCLEDVTETEIELLLSFDCPSILQHGLPFAFISNEKHFITHTTMRSSPVLPADMTLAKRYYKPHIEAIKRQFKYVRDLGGASAEEWIKGLPQRGQQRVSAAIPWEQYEAKDQFEKADTPSQLERLEQVTVNNEEQAPSLVIPTGTPLLQSNSHVLAPSLTLRGNHETGIPLKPLELALSNGHETTPDDFARKVFYPLLNQTVYRQPIASHHGHQYKPERNVREVNKAKAARRADIECRCASLDPPIPLEILNQMPSFQAAIQISQPMTDSAWQMLKPRLLTQMPFAECLAKAQANEACPEEEEPKQRRRPNALLDEGKNEPDLEWEILQEPVRNRIGTIADEVINARWSKGRNVTKRTAARFAADVLVQVRKRFYAEATREDGVNLASPETTQAIFSSETSMPPLILENMKWIFIQKIKTLTDHHQKELFLCNECDNNRRHYGFEGVMQHFAAKHTTDPILRWRAEWPEHPPFQPNPSPFTSHYYKVPTPISVTCSSTSSAGLASIGADWAKSSDISSGSQVVTPAGTAISRHTSASPTTLPSQTYPPKTGIETQQGNASQQDARGTYPNTINAAQPWQISSTYGPNYPDLQRYRRSIPPLSTTFAQQFSQNPSDTSAYQSPLVSMPQYSDCTIISEALPHAFVNPRSTDHAAADMEYHSSNSVNGISRYAYLPQDLSNKEPRYDEYDPLRPKISNRSAKRVANVQSPANHSILIRSRDRQAFVHGKDEENQPPSPKKTYDETFDCADSPRTGSSNGQFPSYQNSRVRGKNASSESSDHGMERYGATSAVNHGQQSLLSITQPIKRLFNADKFGDRFISSIESCSYKNPFEIGRTADHKRSEQYPQSLDTTGVRGGFGKEIDQSKALVQIPGTYARHRHSLPTQEYETRKQTRLLSRKPCQDDQPHLSSKKLLLHRKIGCLENKDPTVGLHASRYGIRSQHCERSRSPPREMPESMLYRTRTPIEEDRGDPMHHAWKTRLSRHQGAEKGLSYDYPTRDHYQVVNEEATEARYQPHVKSLPPTVKESTARALGEERTKYAMNRPDQRIVKLEYENFEPMDTTESFYEIDGEWVPTSQVQFVEAPSEAVARYSPEL